MPEMGDKERLREFEQHGSEAVFAEMGQRHVNLVHSAAMRQVGIPAHAEEITQAACGTILKWDSYDRSNSAALMDQLHRAGFELPSGREHVKSATFPRPSSIKTWRRGGKTLDSGFLE